MRLITRCDEVASALGLLRDFKRVSDDDPKTANLRAPPFEGSPSISEGRVSRAVVSEGWHLPSSTVARTVALRWGQEDHHVAWRQCRDYSLFDIVRHTCTQQT